MTGPVLIKAASLNNYCETARALGVNPLPLLRRCGIRAADLDHPESRLSLQSAVRLLELTADAARVEDFGLRVGATRRLSNLGMLALLAYVEPTVRDALHALIRYLPVHTDAVEIRIEDHGARTVIREDHRFVAHLRNRQEVELSIAVLHRVLKSFLGDAWRPQRVCFTHTRPRGRTLHAQVFGVSVEFDAEMDCIVCRSDDLDRPIPTADPVAAAYLRRQLGTMGGSENASLEAQVRALVTELLPTGRCSAAAVAAQLGLPPSTFYRRMSLEPQSYADIVAAGRRELAARYLRNLARSQSEVAGLLGFSSLSAFSRWFKREHGLTAREWRAREAAAGRSPLGAGAHAPQRVECRAVNAPTKRRLRRAAGRRAGPASARRSSRTRSSGSRARCRT